jgi:hypothetical protein
MDDFFKKSFNSWSEYEIEFQKWCDIYYQPAVKRSSELMSETDPISKTFKYNFVVYNCHHAGSVREGKVDNSRLNQQTECIGCNEFKLFYNKKLNKYCFRPKVNLIHNHDLNERRYNNYAHVRNKKMNNNQAMKKQLTEDLLLSKAPVHKIAEVLNKKEDTYFTNKDIHNFNMRLKKAKFGNSNSQEEKIRKWIDNFLKKHPDNHVGISVDENDKLQCIFFQSWYMKDWYNKHPEIVHIDSTFKINVEDFELYSCLVQNGNMHGRPFCYCLMSTSSKETLEFLYKSLLNNKIDLAKTTVVIVDKDLTNVHLIKKYFTSAIVLLCSFHVLKYLKSYISKLLITQDQKIATQDAIRSILYTETPDNIIEYIEIIKQNGTPEFDTYFNNNWLNCKDIWMLYYRKNLITFGTNTNNHIESFHRVLKMDCNRYMHINETIEELMTIVENFYNIELNIASSLKVRVFQTTDCQIVLKYSRYLHKQCINLIKVKMPTLFLRMKTIYYNVHVSFMHKITFHVGILFML